MTRTSKEITGLHGGLLRKALAVALFALPVVASISSVDARPQYANETGWSCNNCHIGQMASKQFTPDGYNYCIYLENSGLLSPPCQSQTIDLYDNLGNWLQNYTHCVPTGGSACN